jgi:hypothetical protein
MKILFRLTALLGMAGSLTAAEVAVYTNFIRQVQLPSGVQWDATVAAAGTQLSSLAIDPGGARFDLWTVLSTPLTNYLLDTAYVGTYVPQATVLVRSEDPYAIIPRTRADRPFYVDITVSGLLSGATDPVASKSVKLLRHVQSYGVGGTGIGIDRTQATLFSQASLATNGSQTLTYALTSVPGADRSKVRGEERFSIFSLQDTRVEGTITYNVPETQICSQFIQIWPVADASVSGVAQNQVFRFAMPQLTLTYNDLYPSSTTYAQVYKGEPVLGKTGSVVPGSSLVINDSVPVSRILTLNNYDSVFTSDGRWTMEIVTSTPFGIDRLSYVSFDVDRTIELNGTFTTIE